MRKFIFSVVLWWVSLCVLWVVLCVIVVLMILDMINLVLFGFFLNYLVSFLFIRFLMVGCILEDISLFLV